LATTDTTTNRPILALADLEAFDPHVPAGGRERRFCCPLPSCADKARGAEHRSLAVNMESGAWCCHRCDASGKLREFWSAASRSSRARASVALRRAFRLEAPTFSPPPATAVTWRAAWRTTRLLAGTPGAAYLAGRAIPVELATACSVRFAPSWLGRASVVFPLIDPTGRVVAAHGRAVVGDAKITLGPRSQGVFVALPPEQTDPAASKQDPVAIVEAPIDALSLALCGCAAIALCGTEAPAWLPARLAFRRVLVVMDADNAGDAAATTLGPQLRAFGAMVERWRPAGANDVNALLVQDPLRLGIHLLWPGARLIDDARSATTPVAAVGPAMAAHPP
jgi:hypothetical protein